MRRLWILAALAITACMAAIPATAGAVTYTDGVASGDVTSKHAILWTRVDQEARVNVTVYTSPSLDSSTRESKGKFRTDADRDFTVKIDVKGLRPHTQYWYQFDSEGDTSPVGTFLTAPKAHNDSFHDVNFGYTGDFDVTRTPQGPPHTGAPTHPSVPPFGTGTPTDADTAKVFDALRAEIPDFWSYLGDTVYQDSSYRSTGPAMTLQQYRETYREQRSYINVREMFAAAGAYNQWDDHEVYNDFDSETVDPVRYANGRKAFLENNPIREKFVHDPACIGDPMYRTFNWGDAVDLFIPDERSCRSRPSTTACFGDLAPTLPQSARQTFPFSLFLSPTPPAGCQADLEDPSRTLLGRKQKARFKKDLLHSDAQYKFVINEVPIQQFYVLPYDRWEGYVAERNEILDFIRDNDIQNVVFLTTDTHATIQGDVYKDFFADPGKIADEMVTGPVGTDTYQQEVIATAGPVGLFAVNSAFAQFTRVECKNFNRYSYAKVDVTAGGTTTNTSKDDTGTPVVNTNAPPVPPTCIDTYGP